MSKMKQVEYWAAHEERWHKQYLALERICDRLEQRVFDLEAAIKNADKYPMPLACRQMLLAALGGKNESR